MKFIEDGWKRDDGRIMTPGSASAIGERCSCPVKENGNGLGRLTGDEKVTFVVDRECPVHQNWPVDSDA